MARRRGFLEAKSEETSAGSIATREVRQALTHEEWVASNLGWARPSYAVTCLVTNRATIEPDAASVARSLAVVRPDELEDIAASAFVVLRSAHDRAAGQDDASIAAELRHAFVASRLDTDTLVTRLLGRPAARLAKAGPAQEF